MRGVWGLRGLSGVRGARARHSVSVRDVAYWRFSEAAPAQTDFRRSAESRLSSASRNVFMSSLARSETASIRHALTLQGQLHDHPGVSERAGNP
jgi:hypothetical protein